MKATLKISLLKEALYCAYLWAIATLLWGIYNYMAYGCFDVGSMWIVFALLAMGIYIVPVSYTHLRAHET